MVDFILGHLQYLYLLSGLQCFFFALSSEVHICVLSRFNRVWLFATLWTVVCQAPLSLRLSSQEYWNGLPCPPLGDLPDTGIELVSCAAPALQVDSSPLSHQGRPFQWSNYCIGGSIILIFKTFLKYSSACLQLDPVSFSSWKTQKRATLRISFLNSHFINST